MPASELDISRIVNTDILQDLLDAFYEATGLPVGVHNQKGELIRTTPKEDFTEFCRIMYFSRQGHKRCRHSDSCGAVLSFEHEKPFIYHCHADLIDVSAPIAVNGEYVGSVACGQCLVQPLSDAYRLRVRRRLVDLPGELQNRLMKAIEKAPIIPLPRLQGIARLLSAIANNIVNLILSNIREKELSMQSEKILSETKARAFLEKEMRNAQLQLKEAELKAMQAQINPHFLYNTLDSIQWLAVLHDVEDIRQSIFALGQLLRHSLDRKSMFVTVRREIDQVQNYLLIQKLRYQEKLSVHLNIEEEVMECQVPKLILQPVVENAIVHGLEPKSEKGNIWIDGWAKNEDEAVIEIIDDGVGIPAATRVRIEQALKDAAVKPEELENQAGHHSIGLANVHKRLSHIYGEKYGVELDFSMNNRTCVRIRVPRRQEATPGSYGQTLDSSHSG